MKIFMIPAVALALFTQPALAKTGLPQKLTADLDALLEKDLKDQKIVGAVVMVSRDGKLIYSHAAGLEDREAAKPMKTTTAFRLASMTKAIVSAAAVRLIEDGKLKLDDPVTKYLPFFHPKMAGGKDVVITVQNLITHTAGLNYGFLEPKDGPYHKLRVSEA